MDTIRVYGAKTKEHKRLEAAAMLINAEFDDKFGEAEVVDASFDYGEGIQWTTIRFSNTQALTPVQQAMITLGGMGDFSKAVSEVIETHKKHMELVNTIRYGG